MHQGLVGSSTCVGGGGPPLGDGSHRRSWAETVLELCRQVTGVTGRSAKRGAGRLESRVASHKSQVSRSALADLGLFPWTRRLERASIEMVQGVSGRRLGGNTDRFAHGPRMRTQRPPTARTETYPPSPDDGSDGGPGMPGRCVLRGPGDPLTLARSAPAQAPLAMSSTRLTSIFTPGPIVEETDSPRTNRPLAAAGLARNSSAVMARRLSRSWAGSNDALPIGT